MTSIDLQLPDEQAARLDSFARAVHKSRNEATAQLIEEALRHEDFPAVEFRDSASGRQAYVVGSGLAVWEVLMVAADYDLDPARTAAHLPTPGAFRPRCGGRFTRMTPLPSQPFGSVFRRAPQSGHCEDLARPTPGDSGGGLGHGELGYVLRSDVRLRVAVSTAHAA